MISESTAVQARRPLKDTDRLKLRFGPYKAPKFKVGDIVRCEVWGEVEIVQISDAPIQSPIGKRVNKRGGRPTLVVIGDLIEAVKRESNQAICQWWGACPTTVWNRRRTFNVPLANEGTSQVRSEYFNEEWALSARKKAHAPARCAKIAAAGRGNKRPPHVIEAMIKARNGRKLSDEQRKRMHCCGPWHRRMLRCEPGGVWRPSTPGGTG